MRCIVFGIPERKHFAAWSLDNFLAGIYHAFVKSDSTGGDPFDIAFLMTPYRSEYHRHVILSFVKKGIIFITLWFEILMGRYKHFKGASAFLKWLKDINWFKVVCQLLDPNN